ncbi:MAG TPA: hypothetical protein VFQ61_22720, partial [Polyangiaceae bacterium]|nr:hypothetical protein [Polyangiaceae bacterium]
MQSFTQISRGLAEIAGLLEFAGEPKFKVKAYANAAEVVDTLGDELASLVEQNRLQELPGIGRAIEQQIQELWNTGTSALLARLRSEQPEGA